MTMNIKDFKIAFGFYKHNGLHSNIISAFCNCGYTTSVSNWKIDCPNCGSIYLKRIDRPLKTIKTVIDGMIDLIEKDEKSFYIKKTEVVAHIKVKKEGDNDSYTVEFIEGKLYELKYSLRTKEMHILKDGNALPFNDKNLSMFFRVQMDTKNFLDVVSCDKNREMFQLAINHLGRLRNERNTMIGRALQRLFQCPSVEILNSCGFKNIKYIFQKDYILYSQKTKPHEIFGVSKYVFNIIKDMNSIGWNTLQNLKSLELKLNGNTIKEILQIAKEESKISDIID